MFFNERLPLYAPSSLPGSAFDDEKKINRETCHGREHNVVEERKILRRVSPTSVLGLMRDIDDKMMRSEGFFHVNRQRSWKFFWLQKVQAIFLLDRTTSVYSSVSDLCHVLFFSDWKMYPRWSGWKLSSFSRQRRSHRVPTDIWFLKKRLNPLWNVTAIAILVAACLVTGSISMICQRQTGQRSGSTNQNEATDRIN